VSAIGLVHAGWRGTKEQILAKVVTELSGQYSVDRKSVHALFGPAIRACCYEVGEEFYRYFPDDMVKRKKKHYLDLAQTNMRQLTALGIPSDQIHDCQLCTCCHEEFFSFRREGKSAGRMLSLMYIRK